MAEANESPADCLRREIREELGLDLAPGRMFVTDWVPPHGPWDDMIAFIFDGGILDARQISEIRLLDGELDGIEFVEVEKGSERLRPRAWRRLQAALDVLACALRGRRLSGI